MEGISKKRWNLGLRVTIGCGLVGAMGSWGLDFTIKQAVIVTSAILWRELHAFFQKYPIESINDLDSGHTKFLTTDVKVQTKLSDQPNTDRPFEGK